MLANFTYDDFLPILARAFSAAVVAPPRSHHETGDTTLLLMPAWNDRHLGVKTVTVTPGNRERGLPSVFATYTLFDAASGQPIARLDGKTLTNLRTAAASALASQFLSPPDASSLLIIGHGTLAPELIRAHASVRPLQHVRVHGRCLDRVRTWIDAHSFGDLDVQPTADLDEAITDFADIISCATTSAIPVFPGRLCIPGQHIDLVGSYQRHTREADDDLMSRAHVVLDTSMAAIESGDIAIPLASGVLTQDRVLGTLGDLTTTSPTIPDDAITVFKSVGVALEDLALAEFIADVIIDEAASQ